MSQTATLSDFTRTPFDLDAGSWALETDPKSRSALLAAYNGIWELSVTVIMLIMAPLVLVALAGAFVVAWPRMHHSVRGVPLEPTNYSAITSPPIEQGDLQPLRGGMRTLPPVQAIGSEHLWN